MINDIELYLSRNPSIIVLDPLPNVRQLLDRYRCYSIIHRMNTDNIEVFTPSFCEITSNDPEMIKTTLKNANVHFPFICKPIVGHGTKAHQMSIIFNERCLKDCNPPCVAQSFINHNAILYKIFIVGETIHVCERPSLKNFHASDRDTIFFNSANISKTNSQNELIVLDPEELGGEVVKPELQTLEKIASNLRDAFGMDLIGIDVLIENSTGRYAIIDVNSFPGIIFMFILFIDLIMLFAGYDGFPNFLAALLPCIKQKIEAVKAAGDS